MADSYDHLAGEPMDVKDHPDNSDNLATSIARGMNSISRATGLPYNPGAVGVQTNADMVKANDISNKFRK